MSHRILHGLLFMLLFACLPVLADSEEGMASYYADSLHGNPTASGEPYDKDALTAAHRTLDFGTEVRVTNLENGKSVVVRINDRGPHVESRLIDISGAAAQALGLIDAGTARVKVEVQEG
jgi:rare lipoprotein A